MFRGLLLAHLRRRWRWLAAAPVVSLIFAAIHPQGWVAIPALATIAMALAALREQRGNLLAPMFMHGINNLLLMILLVCAAA